MKYLKFFLLLLILLPISVKANNKAVVDITKMSISDLNKALAKGYLTSELLTLLYLDRIEEYDSEFNAIREINSKALSDAKKLDEERENGHVRGPLHGIPILVKNNIDVTGMATTAGARALENNYPNSDAEVIKKLKEAGVIILATTNMSEFAFIASDSKSSYGNVLNAFNPLYSAYGSSGGSAVGLALSFASASLGTDTNSSVRVPAAAAGLVGLRPTFGMISMEGVIPYDIYRDTVGIITKTVNDNKIILEELGIKISDNKEKIKIGVIESYIAGDTTQDGVNGKTDLDIIALTNKTIKLLEKTEFELINIETLVDNYYLSIATNTMSGMTFCDGFNKYIKNTTGEIRSFASLVRNNGHIYSLGGYLTQCNAKISDNIMRKKEIFREHIDEVMEYYDVDVLIYPTVKNKILKIGEDGLVAPGSYLGSVIGYPSVTVPMGYIECMPYGIEIFGKKERENIIYKVAKKIEELTNLNVANSPLAPSLYEIPSIVEDLKRVSEKYYKETDYLKLNLKTKNYFLDYNNRSNEENEIKASLLLKAYDKQEKKIAKIFIYIFSILDILVILITIQQIIINDKRKAICK